MTTPVLDLAFAALSDPTRREIVQRLAKGAARVTDLVQPFDMSFNAVSKHVKVLERAGLVRRTRAGREHHIALDPDRLRIEGDMVLAACPRAPHQPGALEHLHVLRDGVERHVEGLDEVGYARGALRQPSDDLSARRVRERREGAVENRGRHIFNLWVEYSNWPALVKRSEVTL